MTNLDQLKQRRPARRKVVDAHKDRMLAETRAWRLRELREQFDLTQVELAAELDVSQNRVSRIERGDLDKTQVDTLRRYVEALGGMLRLEVQVSDDTFQIAQQHQHPLARRLFSGFRPHAAADRSLWLGLGRAGLLRKHGLDAQLQEVQR